MLVAAGIDCGTGFTKALVVGRSGPEAPLRVLGKGRVRSGVQVDEAAQSALEIALGQAGLDREAVDYIACTGFGRYNVSFRDVAITEITAAARGAFTIRNQGGPVLDIGSQCTRAIAVTSAGKVQAFKSNDKCAAGSGTFIARAAKYLGITVEEVGELSLGARNPQPISSICAVLAESEIINHVSAGVSVEDILRGIHQSLADRAGAMLRKVRSESPVLFIGGVAKQRGMTEELRRRLGVEVEVPHDCDFVCALGAAVLALRRLAARN
ncbi:MAG: 2-hydroxyglutaryl-CoA dehydratase [Acidobacteria bacterium]|nr:2-hydroxyglutaryl-CoA dehydratase [Acidobacteriota bacterium]